ncbi:ferritin-like domain-containing protein [Hoyosella subflava]|uniref:Conserved hypothetical alanine rich protein n=1 Tax=Hoyosella subflava (strain DSM 45089 / JCM 17490 / NBRC 109087 / DQS3-9A1) TaxID=443218 RepID=F6EJP3_HOYSD|nr:ferritin-like domain-containing protein [Hoyosella subflava]AEF40068.1 Conserved hypothetical alanine rich protein [Hoyosella subflava DQS3-9A1]
MHDAEEFPGLSRRAVVQVTALLLAGAVIPGCATEISEPEPDPLIAQRELALRDARAAAAQDFSDTEWAAAVADQRAAHATALDAEIRRLARPSTDTAETEDGEDVPDGSAPPVSPPELEAYLADSSRSARGAVSALTGYRAGLLSSVGANCAAYLALATELSPPAASVPDGLALAGDPGMDSLRTALEREHAAVFSYGVVAAFSLPERRAFTAAGAEEHRARRDAVSGLLARAFGEAPLAAPAYDLPLDVDSPVTAAELAVSAEQECAAAWRAVTERAESADLREFGVGALTECALRTALWRGVLGAAPVPDPFPGQLD